MKETWKKPLLEVLDVSETMKFWPPNHGGGGKDKNPDPINPEPSDPLFDS
jgi:hypothetical protein